MSRTKIPEYPGLMMAYSHPQDKQSLPPIQPDDLSVGLRKTVINVVDKSMENLRRVVLGVAKALEISWGLR